MVDLKLRVSTSYDNIYGVRSTMYYVGRGSKETRKKKI